MGKPSFSIKFDTSGLLAALDSIQQSAEDLHRPAAQAGAQVLYDEVLQRVPISKKTRTYKGKTYQPGTLRKSIYQVFSVDNSGKARSTYHVSWNARKAPHGHLVEYGTVHAPAHPFIRPSWDAKRRAALEATRQYYLREMDARIKRIRK